MHTRHRYRRECRRKIDNQMEKEGKRPETWRGEGEGGGEGGGRGRGGRGGEEGGLFGSKQGKKQIHSSYRVIACQHPASYTQIVLLESGTLSVQDTSP